MKHGTPHAYKNLGCRCDDCRKASSDYLRRWKAGEIVTDRDLLSDLLHELFPLGLTDDCPARRAMSGDGGNLRR